MTPPCSTSSKPGNAPSSQCQWAEQSVYVLETLRSLKDWQTDQDRQIDRLQRELHEQLTELRVAVARLNQTVKTWAVVAASLAAALAGIIGPIVLRLLER